VAPNPRSRVPSAAALAAELRRVAQAIKDGGGPTEIEAAGDRVAPFVWTIAAAVTAMSAFVWWLTRS
jgi:hypothetical protein